MTTTQITPLQKHAISWTEFNAESKHLTDLLQSGSLNEEQEAYINEYNYHVSKRIETFESYLMELDGEGKFYNEVREVSDTLTITPSEDFLSHLESQLDEMNLDGIDFQIKSAVEKFNSFHYSCAIYVNSFGYVDFNGCKMESNASATVLFNKSDKRQVTIKDVKNKLKEVGH